MDEISSAHFSWFLQSFYPLGIRVINPSARLCCGLQFMLLLNVIRSHFKFFRTSQTGMYLRSKLGLCSRTSLRAEITIPNSTDIEASSYHAYASGTIWIEHIAGIRDSEDTDVLISDWADLNESASFLRQPGKTWCLRVPRLTPCSFTTADRLWTITLPQCKINRCSHASSHLLSLLALTSLRG